MDKARCYDHRDRDKAPGACALCSRIAIEHRIVKRTVEALLNAGFLLNIDNGGDTEELSEPSNVKAIVLKELAATDDEYLKVYTLSPDGHFPQGKGWVRFVYGNDGPDVISDYSTSLEEVLKPVNDYADTLG